MMAASVFASGLINPIGLRAAGLDGALPGLGSHTIHASVHLSGRTAFKVACCAKAC